MESPSSNEDTMKVLQVPVLYWECLGCDEKIDYMNMRNSFAKSHCNNNQERQPASLFNDLQAVLTFVESRKKNQEARAIVAGIKKVGKYICVNTRQLKCLLCRCKSSINNSFQQLGYVSAKSKSKNVLLGSLPSLLHNPILLRQWTIRCSDRTPIQISPSHRISRQIVMPIIQKVFPKSNNETESCEINGFCMPFEMKSNPNDTDFTESLVSPPNEMKRDYHFGLNPFCNENEWNYGF